MSVCCVSIGLYDKLITRPEESYLLSVLCAVCVCVCGLCVCVCLCLCLCVCVRVCVGCVCVCMCGPETLTVRRSRPQFSCCCTEDK